ncbi:NAD+ synthase [Candidatus Poribacteria bacterium]|nr:MAG: NAD+ synthase [Candidatus Poribacteria bacterium]
MSKIRLAMAQINTTVGDIEGNVRKIKEYLRRAKEIGADIVTFPELAITGYPPEDLLLKPDFISANLKALQDVAAECKGITAIVGFVDRGEDIYNAAALIHDGQLKGVYHKIHLPNHSAFDENRYFQAGEKLLIFSLKGHKAAINICEDMWYPQGPTRDQSLAGGAELILNISASPYHAGKVQARERMLATRANDNLVFVAYNNLVGGQDELVFDGGSAVFNQQGELIARGKLFEEELVVADLNLEEVFKARLHDPRRRMWRPEARRSDYEIEFVELEDLPSPPKRGEIVPTMHDLYDRVEEIYRALVLGTRDYFRKNNFKQAIVGMSGGIDSSLTTVIAVDALGKENVLGVSMPSRYSSIGTQTDARKLAENLGIRFLVIPIEKIFQAYLDTLAPVFEGYEPDVTEENIQARIRGNILMALSNKFGALVLSTGNKSEVSVGYCTLYGDMAGGFSVLKDVPKTLVYELAEYRNKVAGYDLIPRTVFTRPPSAELRPNQKDSDSIPEYSILDPILHAYVEEDRSVDEIVEMGFDREVVLEVIRMVDRNEYKRRQAPPGIKITPRAFGKDRRMPITNRYIPKG